MDKANKTSKFQYYIEDTACTHCRYFLGKKRGCTLLKCCCEDITQDALTNGRVKREKGVLNFEK